HGTSRASAERPPQRLPRPRTLPTPSTLRENDERRSRSRELRHRLPDSALHRLATGHLRLPAERFHPPRVEAHLGHIAPPAARLVAAIDPHARRVEPHGLDDPSV